MEDIYMEKLYFNGNIVTMEGEGDMVPGRTGG